MRIMIKLSDFGNTKINILANQQLHLDLISPLLHFNILNVDIPNSVIYVSILTHQPKYISLLNSKGYNLNIPDDKVQQIRTKFAIQIHDNAKLPAVVNFLQTEQSLMLQTLKHIGTFKAVITEVQNSSPLISHNDVINLTNTRNNIEKVEKTYHLGKFFSDLQSGYLITRIPVSEHSNVHAHFLNNEKKYKETGMSDINDEYNFAKYMSKALQNVVSTHGVFSKVSGRCHVHGKKKRKQTLCG